jgi:hypothetical protein
LLDIDNKSVLIAHNPQGIGQELRPCPIHLLNFNITILNTD